MGTNTWESGEFKLPAAEFARVRKCVEDSDRKRKEKVFDETQKFWQSLTPKQKRDRRDYGEAAYRFSENLVHRSPQLLSPFGGFRAPDASDRRLADDVGDMLAHAKWNKIRRVLKTDMEIPTNRTTEFREGEANLTFDRDTKTVHWDVYEDKRAVESARATGLWSAFSGVLDQVKWTRGTGGVIHGNNEHNVDAGNGHYIASAYGPIGADEDPYGYREYTDSKGNRSDPRTDIEQKHRPAKSPGGTGGQFMGKSNSGFEGTLPRW